MMRWLLTMLFLFGLSGTVDAREIKVPSIEVIIKRVSEISGLPVAPPPKAIREVPISVIYAYTRKHYARATYLCVVQRLLFSPMNISLIPHELTHMLQCAARIDPASSEGERQAARVQRIYYQKWPNTWSNTWPN